MSRSNILLIFLGGILALRMTIWQFFPDTKGFFREDFSDVAIATLIIAIALFWILGKLVKRQTLKESGLELPIFIFMLSAGYSLFHTVDMSSSLRSVLVLGAEIAFFYILLDLLDTPKRIRFILIFLAGLCVIASVYGIKTFFDYSMHAHLQKHDALLLPSRGLIYLSAHPRAISFFGWPNTLAGFFLLFLPLMLILPIYFQKSWLKVLSVLALISCVVCFLCTFSFLGWTSFLISTIVLVPFFRDRFKVKIWPVIFVFLTLFIFVILRKDLLASLSPRLFYYKAAFTLVGKNPLWGWGWNVFGLMSSSMTKDVTILSSYVHNSYLQVWVEGGILGFWGIALLAVSVFKKVKAVIYLKEQQREYLLLIAVSWGIMAFLIDNLFSFTILLPHVALYWWSMLAIFCAMLRMRGHSERSEETLGVLISPPDGEAGFASLRMTIIKSVLFVLLVFVFVLLLRMTAGYTLYYRSQKGLVSNDPIWILNSTGKAIETLKRAEVLDPWSAYLPAERGYSYVRLYGITRLKGMLMLAKVEYVEAIRRSPKNYYNYFVLGKIFAELGDRKNEDAFTQKASELSPGEFALDNSMFYKEQ